MSDQSDTVGPIGKISTGDSGLGTVTPEMVDKRAAELARMDGRTEPHDGDRDRAQQELVGPMGDASGPEVADAELDNVTIWDEAPEVSGSQTRDILPDDDASIAETLVQEGLEEAEHDQRLSAADANPPEAEEG